MLIKEYRILLPLSVEEYRIAQLYMIQKKSRIDSSGQDSGVEILTNKPYSDGPGGSGQYTFKIYHIGSKIPTWIRSVLPVTALQAHEEAWNAYPFTKTRYSCPIMDKFSFEVQTKYFNDTGGQENVFDLSGEDLKNRIVDVMDFVNDPLSYHDYLPEEDPKLYHSDKTGRGPLSTDWVNECIRNNKPIMCAYKLCKVEFRYWGLQTRAERWIHSFALRNTMLRAHRQAWAWQDEWHGLSMEEVRKLEDEAALHLSRVMARAGTPESTTSSEIFFDCLDVSPQPSEKSMVHWSSELMIDETDAISPTQMNAMENAILLLVIIFQGDIYPETPPDNKTADVNSLKTTIGNLITNHYPQLKSRIHYITISCGSELNAVVSYLISISPSFGIFHPSLALILSSSQNFREAVEKTINSANDAFRNFKKSEIGRRFNGEIFAVGDNLGGLLLYESLRRYDNRNFVSRHSSSLSANSQVIPELYTEQRKTSNWNSVLNVSSAPGQKSIIQRNYSAPPSACHYDQDLNPNHHQECLSRLNFRTGTVFLLGCPLALILAQRKMCGFELDSLDCGQIFNLYYALDPCGARIEPVLHSHLAHIPPLSVPRYQKHPLGDGINLHFDSKLQSSMLWGTRRIDHTLYCPHAMVALPSTALPNILHASYWESPDIAAFILRQFVRPEEPQILSFLTNISTITSKINPGPLQWNLKRTKFKVANLAPNHRANDIIVVEGQEQQINARFCYGPMDLVAISREEVSFYVCPIGGDWELNRTCTTDAHGRVSITINLPVGIHCVKAIVHGDHSFLDLFVAVLPVGTPCVVFSFDGSLTGSVSVTGRDPRIRAGAVDVVRFWQELGYTVIYVTARPDLQQKAISTWLALHNFPHGILFFAPSFSTDPLKHKTQYLHSLIEMGIRINAAYGSSKDVSVYAAAGVDPSRIFSVSRGKRRNCTHIESYSLHLIDLSNGKIPFAQPLETSLIFNHNISFKFNNNNRNLVQRTHSFTPRSGRYENQEKFK